MATWAKIKFFWETMLGSSNSSLTASTTGLGDYDVHYLFNMLETNCWRSENAVSPQYITYDAGEGNLKSADYLAVIGHNLKSCGAAIALQYSSDNFISDINDAFTPFSPTADSVILKEFSGALASRYWRLKITNISEAVFIAICIWGNKTELDYATVGFDPHEQDAKASVNLSYSGYIAGIHNKYVERSMSIAFNDADAELYQKVKNWWDTSGLKNFFVAWDTANNPEDVFLMRPDTKFSNPFKNGGVYRDITLRLTGRKE
ncbi:MAG: hypothetical protein HYS21_13670 [Deltaproteobacteria bacterium]|nr:hypothetical protein [Deltaproteobacteria bacterium]